MCETMLIALWIFSIFDSFIQAHNKLGSYPLQFFPQIPTYSSKHVTQPASCFMTWKTLLGLDSVFHICMGVGTSIGAYPQRRKIFSVSEMINWQSFLSKGRVLEVFYPIHAMMWLAWYCADTGSCCESMSVIVLSFLEDSIHSTLPPALTFFLAYFPCCSLSSVCWVMQCPV